MLTGVKAFCNGSRIYEVPFANGTQDVWGQLSEINQALKCKGNSFKILFTTFSNP
jgi:hypothetical protein